VAQASSATLEALELLERLERTGAKEEDTLERVKLIQALIAVHTTQPSALQQLELLLQSPQPEVRLRALNAYSALQGARGEFESARSALEQSLTLARAGEALDVVAQTLSNLGTLTQQLGAFEASERHWREALELWRRLEHVGGEVMVLGNLAAMHLEYGAYGFAWNSATEALELARREGLVLPQLLALRTLVTLELRFHRTRAALELLTQHQSLAKESSNDRLHRVGEVIQVVINALKLPYESARDATQAIRQLERENLGVYAQVLTAWLALGTRHNASKKALIERLGRIKHPHYHLIWLIAQGQLALRTRRYIGLTKRLENALQSYPSEWRALGYAVLEKLYRRLGQPREDRITRAAQLAAQFRQGQLEGLPQTQRRALESKKL
jgi:tetratricopeptide (TPR) repeat protein